MADAKEMSLVEAITPQQGRIGLRRSLYAPFAARKNKLATQAYLRAAEFGNLKAVRALALEDQAELAGQRCKDFLGCDPHHLVESAHHLSTDERKTLKYEFRELPELLNAVGTVKAMPAKLGRSASYVMPGMSADDTKPPESSTPRLAKTNGISGRLARSENNLTRLAGTVAARHPLCEAAKKQPQLLWEKARTGEQALPALARVLRSERLAVHAAHKNPALLRISEAQIRKIMPTLVSLCGGAEEAAYAIASRPELLQVEAASSFRSSLQALAGFFGNLKDGLFLLGQTTVPPSVKVTGRQFCREYMVGDYFLVGGAQVDDRPVWCKPASAMAHVGSRAKAVYLTYCQKGVVGSDQQRPCWTFTPNYTSALKKYDACDPEILGWAPSTCKSPDQVPEGDWHFASEKQKTQVPGLWPSDRYVDCVTGDVPRGPWLCMYSVQDLRSAFDLIKVPLHVAWLEAEEEEEEGAQGPRLLGHFLKQDPVFQERSKITFLDTADFAHIRRWLFLQLPASLPDATPVRLRAWEPIEVCMLFSVEEGGSQDHQEYEEALSKADFRLMPEGSVAKVFPKIQGAPAVAKQVWARTYPSGPLEVPIFLGPCKLPPLVFLRSKICALVLGTRPCHMLKPMVGEDLYLPDTAEPAPGDPKPVMYTFVSPGELGYTGYSLFKGPPCSQQCETSQVQMRIESMEQLKVAILLFPFPPAELESEPERSATKRGSSKERPASKNAAASKNATAPKPSEVQETQETQELKMPPGWLAEEKWQELHPKVATTITSPKGAQVKCAYIFEKVLESGQVFSVPGCGPDFFAIFFFKQTSPERPDIVRPLLLREPALLANGDKVGQLGRQLRAELGDAMAREVLVKGAQEVPQHGASEKLTVKGSSSTSRSSWPKLCQEGTMGDIDRWVFEHKVDVLADVASTSEAVAREVLKNLGGLKAPVTVPLMTDRCAALKEVLSLTSIAPVLQKHPRLLTCESSILRQSLKLVDEHIGTAAAVNALRSHPNLLMMDQHLAEFFSILQERFNVDDLRHLQETGSGGWAKWPHIVGKPRPEIQEWRGLVAGHFRQSSCAGRVVAFGAEPQGAAALAQLSGEIPEIPPLLLE